ncbi:MAG: stage III sporulation protein AE [Clostridia bacterium]|nr:stage III sporulation protein AE [Clostridia bacterium]
MKKILKISLLILVLGVLFSPKCFAEQTEENDCFELIGADKLYQIIDDNGKDFFNRYDIDIRDYSWVNKLSAENVFSQLFEICKNGFITPIKSGVSLLCIILISAGLSSFDFKNGVAKAVTIAATLSMALIVVANIWSCITASASALKYISGFMLSFVPIFILAVSLSGAPITGAASGGLILLSADVISYFSSSYVLPIMGGYLGLNLASSISPPHLLSELAEMIKKAVVWSLSFIFTVFIGVIGIQSSVNAAADSFTMKTAKFIIGTCVPIAGGALSESANTIYASMNVLKSSIGIYGVLAVAIAVIPLLVEILIWKGVLGVCNSISKGFSQTPISLFLSSINSLLSVLIAVMLFCGGLFIISLSVVVMVAKV